jgi:transcription termination/antitermination protein NusG
MPLLPMEPFVFPVDLLTVSAQSLQEDSRWWVLHTRPRAEKALARKAQAQELPYFLPLCKRQWRSRGRSFCSHVPLFPGYLFLHGDSETRRQALETNLVACCLEVPDQDQLQVDLFRVHHLMTSGAPLTPEDRLEPGTRVEIIAGPLAGTEGTVIRQGKNLKVYVEVHFLRKGVSAEVESWMIRPLETQHALAVR